MKKQKGMTLIEIVVSLGIYSLLALLLVEIMSVVNTTMRSTNQLNERLSFEAKFADNQIVTSASLENTGNLNITYGVTNFTAGNETGRIGNAANPPRYNGYVTRYTNPKLVGTTDFSELVNYRFMTFSQTFNTVTFPGYAFNMQIMVVPFLNRDNLTDAQKTQAQTDAFTFMSHISHIDVTANDATNNTHLIDETAPNLDVAPTYLAAGTRNLASTAAEMQSLVDMRDTANGGWLTNGTPTMHFAIENLTDPTNETRVQVSNDMTRTAESGGRGYAVVVDFTDDNTINPNTNQPLVRLTVEIPCVYMYVRRGSTESYYSNSMAIIDLYKMRTATTQAEKDDAIIVCRSNNTGTFLLSEYDV